MLTQDKVGRTKYTSNRGRNLELRVVDPKSRDEKGKPDNERRGVGEQTSFLARRLETVPTQEEESPFPGGKKEGGGA